jgi:hypothetical protein
LNRLSRRFGEQSGRGEREENEAVTKRMFHRDADKTHSPMSRYVKSLSHGEKLLQTRHDALFA